MKKARMMSRVGSVDMANTQRPTKNKSSINLNKKNLNKSALNITYDTFQPSNPVRSGDEYLRKQTLIKEYKEILNKDFIKLIAKEKDKESKRETMIQKAQNKEERKKLEDMHNAERAKSFKLINNVNQ